MEKNKIDVIIPAYKAHKTILRTLSSIAEQTILSDLSVVIVNDACPEGSYSGFVEMFSPYMDIREIVMEKNGGPGAARQKGIDSTDGEFFTCIDADDTFNGAIALETLREGINADASVKCCSGSFLQLGDNLQQIVAHQNDMVWMFGKLYRREFIDNYKVRFNDTRANEDTGFNTMVRMLCDNMLEQIRFITEAVYYWHNKPDSITRINNNQYSFDQSICGWTDNMIYAIEHVRKQKPFSGSATQQTLTCMIQLYYHYIEVIKRKPVFLDQNWEYIKKFYHTCYKRIEGDITPETFDQVFSDVSRERWGSGTLNGIVPYIGISDFMEKLRTEEYDPDHIYDIWKRMEEDPETKKLIDNNITCGVCQAGYTNKPL